MTHHWVKFDIGTEYHIGGAASGPGTHQTHTPRPPNVSPGMCMQLVPTSETQRLALNDGSLSMSSETAIDPSTNGRCRHGRPRRSVVCITMNSSVDQVTPIDSGTQLGERPIMTSSSV